MHLTYLTQGRGSNGCLIKGCKHLSRWCTQVVLQDPQSCGGLKGRHIVLQAAQHTAQHFRTRASCNTHQPLVQCRVCCDDAHRCQKNPGNPTSWSTDRRRHNSTRSSASNRRRPNITPLRYQEPAGSFPSTNVCVGMPVGSQHPLACPQPPSNAGAHSHCDATLPAPFHHLPAASPPRQLWIPPPPNSCPGNPVPPPHPSPPPQPGSPLSPPTMHRQLSSP
jgi:hypothetical protein